MKHGFLVGTVLLAALAQSALADCPLAHTHIGKNPTWRPDWNDPGNPNLATDPDGTDDNQLWMFSIPPVHPVAPTPSWPTWGDCGDPFLRLVPELDEFGQPIPKGDGSGKHLFACRFMWSADGGYDDPAGVLHLDGWHSAHGPQGAWDLESVDQGTAPSWDIWVRRESSSLPEDDFLMLLPNDTAVLTTDGSTYELNKAWLIEESAWGFHDHMDFLFWLTDDWIGDCVTTTFSAYDASGQYTASDPFTFAYLVTPEPTVVALCLVGVLALGRGRK